MNFFKIKKGWETPPRFKFGDRFKNKFGRQFTIIDCRYEIGELRCIDDWVYRVKYDDGEYNSKKQSWFDNGDYEILIPS